MPKVYAPSVANDGDKNQYVTHYLAIVGGGSVRARSNGEHQFRDRRNFQHADDRGSCDGRSLDQT